MPGASDEEGEEESAGPVEIKLSAPGELIANGLSSAAGVALAIICLPSGLVPIVGAAFGPALLPYFRAAVAEWSRKSQTVISAAVEVSGDEEVAKRVLESPDLTHLAKQIFAAADRTRDPEKLRQLGRLLGDAVHESPDQIDSRTMVATVLDQLEAPHVRAMAVLASFSPTTEGAAWTTLHLEAASDRIGVDRELVMVAVQTLVRTGVAAPVSLLGAQGYHLSLYGWALFDLLRGGWLAEVGNNFIEAPRADFEEENDL